MSLSAAGIASQTVSLDDVCILHDRVPGRVRLRAPALKRFAALAPLLEQRLRAMDGVHQVTVNPITGSLLILFDTDRVDTDHLLVEISRFLDHPSIRHAPSVTLTPPGSNGPMRRPVAPTPASAFVRPGRGRVKPLRNAPPAKKGETTRLPLDAARHWATRSVGEAFLELDSSPNGLTPAAATRFRARDGANRLPELGRGIGKGIKNFKDASKEEES